MTSFEEILCLDAPLADRLKVYAEQLSDDQPVIADAYSELVARLKAADAGIEAPGLDERMPPFLLPDSDGRLNSLSILLSRGPLVVSFNRGHWCNFCRLELKVLAEIYPTIKKIGGELVSIMPDTAGPIGRLKQDIDIPFPILTDIDNGYALRCGLMISLGNAIKDVYHNMGRELGKFQGNDAWFVPIPATFVISTDGHIKGELIDPDFRNRMAPDDILSCLAPSS